MLDHFLHPRNVGPMRAPDAVGEQEDAACGDLARFFLRVTGGQVVEARFQAYGCGPTIAAASCASELVPGRGPAALAGLDPGELASALGGLPEDRTHAADVVAGALRAAARDWLARAGAGA